jgi:DNA modification methylase
MRAVVPECMRVLKPTGSAVFILQPNSERVGRMRTWLWEFMAWVGKEWGIVQDAYWWNTASLPLGGSSEYGLLRPSLKPCIWVGPPDCYRNQDDVLWVESHRNYEERAAGTNGTTRRPSGLRIRQKKIFARAAERDGGVTPFNVLPIPNTNRSSSAGAHGHGAGTPGKLCSWWLRYLCPPGGAVLDPFGGSGTVGLDALKHGADCTLIEAVPEYVDIARRRLAEADGPLFAAAQGEAS